MVFMDEHQHSIACIASFPTSWGHRLVTARDNGDDAGGPWMCTDDGYILSSLVGEGGQHMLSRYIAERHLLKKRAAPCGGRPF